MCLERVVRSQFRRAVDRVVRSQFVPSSGRPSGPQPVPSSGRPSGPQPVPSSGRPSGPQPVPSSGRPSGGQQQGAPGGNRPSGGQQQGAPGGSRPSGGQQQGAPGGSRPSGGQQQGAPGGSRPSGGQQQGAPGGSRPSGGQQQGAPGGSRSSGGQQQGAPGGNRPSGGGHQQQSGSPGGRSSGDGQQSPPTSGRKGSQSPPPSGRKGPQSGSSSGRNFSGSSDSAGRQLGSSAEKMSPKSSKSAPSFKPPSLPRIPKRGSFIEDTEEDYEVFDEPDIVGSILIEEDVQELLEDTTSAKKRKLSRAQREDVARVKTDALVAKRLGQLESLRTQKRLDDERKILSVRDDEKNREILRTKGKRKDKKGVVQSDVVVKGAPGSSGTEKSTYRTGRDKFRPREEPVPVGPVVRDVIIPETITVGDLANRTAVKSSEVIKLLFKQGMMVTINHILDQDTAVLVVEEMGHRAKLVSKEAAVEAELADSVDVEADLIIRPPVVTIMGHVDHGKTSLLDAIRKTDVAARESGGITQHIGAYQVLMEDGNRITFLDTPGHAAFTAMRARGAKVTDVVVLVVAADDGMMPQTIEAINHAREAKVPIVVAINKIDKPAANPDRVMQQLADYNLLPEAWGGETIFVNVSAKTGQGLDTLKEMILLQSEILNLQANAAKKGRGVIIEAKLDKGRGAVATCLVQNGTLRVGDIFVVGTEWGKIRGLLDYNGKVVTEATPATPVEIIGLSGVPEAGDELVTLVDEKRAREIASYHMMRLKEKEQAKQTGNANPDIFNQIGTQEKVTEIKALIKGDVRGSVEAVSEAIRKITHKEVVIHVIHTGVGGINESDIMLAMASGATVVGFNVRADAKAREMAKKAGIEMHFYSIIYDVLDDFTTALEGKLRPTIRETILGRTLVKEVFRISGVGMIAGCLVVDGLVHRQARVRLVRDHVVVHDGAITTLKRYKDDVKEVRAGMECGIGLDRYNDIKENDSMEIYVQEEFRTTITG
ncbi:MAG: translation initiation factor IF-2 [Magnetococcus sp. DMHC-6]